MQGGGEQGGDWGRRASRRSSVYSSRESSIQRYACMSTAGPRYLTDQGSPMGYHKMSPQK